MFLHTAYLRIEARHPFHFFGNISKFSVLKCLRLFRFPVLLFYLWNTQHYPIICLKMIFYKFSPFQLIFVLYIFNSTLFLVTFPRTSLFFVNSLPSMYTSLVNNNVYFNFNSYIGLSSLYYLNKYINREWWTSYICPVNCHSTFHYSEVQTHSTLHYEIQVNRGQQREHNLSFWKIFSNIRMSGVVALTSCVSVVIPTKIHKCHYQPWYASHPDIFIYVQLAIMYIKACSN